MQTTTMSDRKSIKTLRGVALACLLPVLALTATAARAESNSQAQANYQKERNECMSGQTAESKKTCLREAGAALADAKRGRLDRNNNESKFEQNALARCDVFKNSDDHAMCERRVREGTVEGSVSAGGDIRELSVQVPVSAPADNTPMPPQDSMPSGQ